MTSLYDATREDIEVLLEDQPAFRITQIWDGLYKQLLEPEKILTLPAALRTQMTEMLPTALNSVTTSISDKGDTVIAQRRLGLSFRPDPRRRRPRR